MWRYGSHCPRSFHLWPPQHLIVAQMTRTVSVWSESLSISSSGSIPLRIQQCRCPSYFLQEENTKEELTGDSCKTVDEKNSRSHFKKLTFTTETGFSTCNKSCCFNAELQAAAVSSISTFHTVWCDYSLFLHLAFPPPSSVIGGFQSFGRFGVIWSSVAVGSRWGDKNRPRW